MIRFAFTVLLALLPLTAQAAYEDKVGARLRWLDKITARTATIELRKGETVQYGDLTIRLQACRAQDPLEGADSSAFLQIWEKKTDEEPEWVFSGWMFASSPGLSAMDHPIHDVWVLSCLDQVDRTSEADPEGERGGEE